MILVLLMKDLKCLTNFDLKILAIIFMTIDHIGAILFPGIRLLRAIGRLSLPIFIFLLIEGFSHTTNKRNYFLRLLLFAILSEPIYDLIFYKTFFYPQNQNILFLLTLAFILLSALTKINQFIDNKVHTDPLIVKTLAHIYVTLFFGFLAIILHLDYSIYGIMMVYFMYLFKDHLIYFAIIFLPITILFLPNGIFQSICFLSLILISLYNKEKGHNLKYFFYIYYPLHLLILGIINILIH